MRKGSFIVVALVVASCTGSGATSPERSSPATTTTTRPTTTMVVNTTVPEPVPDQVEPEPTWVVAGRAEELAARLTEAELVVRDPASADGMVADAAFELQLLYRQLARSPEWETEVLAALPADLKHAAWANASARREFRAMHRKLSDTLPAWRIIEPAPADELLAHYQEGEATFGVPWEVLAAVNLVETGMGRIEGFSIAGARGPMQFMPATWEAFGEGDIDDPRDAIMAAARYLAHNGGGRGDIDNALYRYNHSQRYVAGVKHYAAIMAEDPRAFAGFYHWQVVYLSELGDVWLPVGYESAERVPVRDYLDQRPEHHLGTDTR